MKAAKRMAVYGRKSNTQDVEEDAKSVTRQNEDCRALVARLEYTQSEYVYLDDGVSGAAYDKRPEFQQMLRDAAAGEFEAIVFYDADRFGRDGKRSMDFLYALDTLNIEMWDAASGRRVDLNTTEGRIIANLQAEFAQQFRDKIRQHTRAAMRDKAKRGWATMGKIFGYDNVRIGKGHVERKVNDAERAVIVDIYTQFAAGSGARTIAKTLNYRKAIKPRAQNGRTAGWSVSTVRAVLTRPLYRGEQIYGRTQKAYNRELQKVYRDTKREKGQIPKAEETWMRVEVPHLRIIDADLADAVDARMTDRRERYLASCAANTKLAKGDRRALEKAHGKYLLSGGMLLCPSCGGHFEARKYPWKPSKKTAAQLPAHSRGGHPGHVYICSTRRRKPGVCTNTLALPINETDDTVLGIVEGEVLDRSFIKELMSLVQHAPDETEWMTSERERLQKEVDHLVKSIAAGVPGETVAPMIRANEVEIRKLDRRLQAPSVPRVGRERLLAALEQRVKDWKAELRREPELARLMLRRLIGPIKLWEEAPEWCRFEAAPKTDLLAGLASPFLVASPAGFEPAFWP